MGQQSDALLGTRIVVFRKDLAWNICSLGTDVILYAKKTYTMNGVEQ